MKTKTLRERLIIYHEPRGRGYRWVDWANVDLPQPGQIYFVWRRQFVGPGDKPSQQPAFELQWSSDDRLISHGMAGNVDSSTRRFHGWRGTTNGWSIEALGVRRCYAAAKKQFTYRSRYRIVFGPDLKPSRD